MPEGLEVAQVEAVDAVGEMEIFTLFPRVAKVVASKDVSGLAIAKNMLEGLIGGDPHLGIHILKNIIDSLGRKLANANAQASAFPPAAAPSPRRIPLLHLLPHRLRRKRTVLKTTR